MGGVLDDVLGSGGGGINPAITIIANVSPSNSGTDNTTNLQSAIDRAAAQGGGVVRIGAYSSPIPIGAPLVPKAGVSVVGSGWVVNPIANAIPTSGTVLQGDGTFPIFAYKSLMVFTSNLSSENSGTVVGWTLGDGTYRTMFSNGQYRFVTISGASASWLGSSITAGKYAYYECNTQYASYNAALNDMVDGFSIESVAFDNCSDGIRFGTVNQSSIRHGDFKNLYISRHTFGWGFYFENFQECNFDQLENYQTGSSNSNAIDTAGCMGFFASLGSPDYTGNSSFCLLYTSDAADE